MKIQIKLKKENVGVPLACPSEAERRRVGTLEGDKNDIERGHPQGAPLHRAQSRISNFLISLSLFFLFFSIPLFFTTLTLQGMGFEKQMFFYFWLLVGVIAWVFKGIGEGEITFKRTPLDVPIILFLIASFLSAIFSVDKWASFIGPFGIPQKSFLAIFAFAIFYWFLVSNITEKRLRMIINSILFSAGIVGVFMAVKFLGLLNIIMAKVGAENFQPLQWAFHPSFNTIGLLGDLGVFCMMALLLIISNFKFQISNKISKIKYQKISLFLYFFISLFLIYIIFSLFNYLNPYILLIPLAIIIIFSISKLINIGKFAKYFSIILFLAILGLSIFKYSPKITRVDLPAEAGISHSTSLDIAKDAVKENWFFGTGIGTFKYDFAKYRPKYLNDSPLWQAKFYETAGVFEMVSSLGIVGSVAFVLMLLVYLGVGFTALIGKKQRNKETEKQEGAKETEKQRNRETVGIGCANPPKTIGEIQNISANFKEWQPVSLLFCFFISSILLILYCLLSLSSTTIILYTVMISSLFIAALSLKLRGFLGIFVDDTSTCRLQKCSRDDKKRERGGEGMFKEYVISYQTSPQYALAMAFVFVCFITGGVVLFALIGKTVLADAYAGRGNMGRAIQLNNHRSEYYLKIGNDNLKEAIEETKKQRNKETGDDTTVSGDNSDLEKVRQLFVSALNAHKAAVSLAPNDVEVWESFASVSEQIANYDPAILDDAIGAYQKSLELDPANPLVDIHLGRLKLIKFSTLRNDKAQAQTLAGEAKVCYNKAVELKPDLKEAYEGLAMSEEYLGNFEQAINIYKKLFSVQIKSEAYPYKIAQLYEVMGDKENAEKYYKITLENVGDRAGAEEVKGEIEKRMSEAE